MFEEMTRFEALKACRDKAGDDSKLARALGTNQPKVWRWMNQTKQIGAEYVLLAEQLYGVSRHVLRPDYYPREVRFLGVDMAAGRDIECGPIRVSFDRREFLQREATR